MVGNPADQEAILSCIDSLHDSWTTGLEELFRSESEGDIEYYLQCLMSPSHGSSSLCENPDNAGEYDLNKLMNNCVVLVYLGVRFE